MEEWMWVIWLSLFILALIIEAVGTDLVSIWFAAGALVALVLSLIPPFGAIPWWAELIAFVVVSIATLSLFRPLVHKYMRRDLTNSNVDEMKGKKGIMTAKIDMLHHGECKINDVVWTAIGASERDSIPVGSVVEVLAVSGNKLIVKKVEETTEGEKK